MADPGTRAELSAATERACSRLDGPGIGYTPAMSSRETASSALSSCPACGAEVPPADEAMYCVRCGHPLSGASDPPRRFGVLQPGPTFVLGCLLLAAAVLVLAAGSAVAAIVLAALAAATFVLFYGAAERDPDSTVVRTLFTSGRRVRGWTVFGKESAGAWALATRDVARLRTESRALRRERKRTLFALGEAAYEENTALAGALRLRLKEIDEGLGARQEARIASLANARRRVQDERVAVQPTQQFSADELTSGKEAPPDPS